MANPILHYVYDPLCGWCYAATPMVEAARRSGVRIMLHGGGLWDRPTRLDPERRTDIRRNDGRIAELTGQPFLSAYMHGLLDDPATIFWSEPTIAAVIAAGLVADGGDLHMLHAIQVAHYKGGRSVVETDVLSAIAMEIGFDRDRFVRALADSDAPARIDGTRRWMRELGLGGYPSFVLEEGSQLRRLQHEPFYADPDGFVDAIARLGRSLVAA